MTHTHITAPLRATALAGVAALVLASPVAATTSTVQMNDGYSFSPTTITIARGDTLKWKNNAVVTDHDVFGAQPSSYISSGSQGGMQPGASYSRVFDSAGTFPYLCRTHSSDGMTGTVIVPIKVDRLVVDGVVKFKITVGSAKLATSSPFRRVIQIDPPGGTSTFVDVKTTRNAAFTYVPMVAGTYRFRSLVERSSNDTRSQPSPYRSVTK